MSGISSTLDLAEERNSELEDNSEEITPNAHRKTGRGELSKRI